MEGQDKQDYIKAFNQGYRLAKEVPAFSSKALQNLPEKVKNKPRMQGLADGMNQFSREKYLAKTRSQTPLKSPPKKDKGRGR